MNKEELLKKVRRVEIKTRRLSNDIFAGKYHSAFKGRGMSFSEVREYRIGDQIRDIDWNVTARQSKPHIKVFEEERELTLMLLVDMSGSGNFGTVEQFKRDVATELSAVLAFSAAQNNDKVGCIFFTDRVERYVPPKKGRSHVLRIIAELLEFRPEGTGTDIGAALEFLVSVQKKRATAFVISDFEDAAERWEKPLQVARSRHDLVGLRLYDRREVELPNVGVVELQDAETGKKIWIDTASASVRRRYAEVRAGLRQRVEQTLARSKVDTVAVATNDDYVAALIKLFSMR